jgi:ABC-type multidrug transport system fused ATPase/permease subunit
MLRPKKSKNKEKIKLSKDSYKQARKIFRYLKPYRTTFAIGWIFLVLSSSAGLFFPYLLGQLLGGESTEGVSLNRTDQVSMLESIDFSNINTVALLLLILFVLQSLFSYFRIVLFTHVTENALRDLRKDAFQRLIYMPMDFYNRNKVGALTSRLSADITLIQDTLRTTIAEFFRQIIIIIGSIVFITIVSWKLALIMLATVPLMAVIAVLFGRFIRRLSKEAQDAAADSNSIIEESLMGINNVKTFTNEGFVFSKYQKAIETIRSINIKSGNWRGLFVSFIILCLFGAIIFIIWQGLHMTLGPNPTLERGDFFAFVMFTVFMGASIGSIPDLYATIQKAVGATEHLMGLMEEETEKITHTGKEKPSVDGKVSFKNVHFHYPQRKDVTVLNDITLEVDAGKKVALVGTSGAGKTTIAALIQRFYSPTSGTILIDNTNQDDFDLDHLRRQIALVPQEVILFSGTIRDNILFGNPNASEEEIISAAEKANALGFIQEFPDGLNTEVGDRGIQLSGGQKQRIAIARAIIKDPKILLLDEATSALDSSSEKLVQDALDKLMEGRTSFIIAHRLATIKKADEIIVLEKGKVIEQGSHQELVEKEGKYAELHKLQLLND